MLGIIVSQFPETHETFIVRELTALRGAGLRLRIYSLKRCRDRVVHSESQPLLADTDYVAWDDPRVFVQAVVEGLCHPMRSVATLGWTLRMHRWPPSTLAKALVVWLQSLAIARRMRRDTITHVHAHWATMPTTAAAIISRWLQIPMSFTAHAWDIFVPNPSLKEKVRLASKVITCTEYNRRYLSHFCPEEKRKIVLNYHGVDLEQFARLRVSEFKPANPPTPLFLSVGRLVETKGFEVLLEAYQLLQERGVAFRAVIVGHGSLERHLRQQIRQRNLTEIVEIRPAMSQAALRELYAQAYAFALPCVVAKNGDRDGIPNVLLEAMAMGLPVVSTAVSGILEAVHDKRDGLMVPANDPIRLADALDLLIRKPTWARVLGDHGRMWAETQFDAREHMQRLVIQMKDLLTSRVGELASWRVSELEHPTRQPLRVMYVVWSLGLGGAEQVVIRLAAGLDRRRFQPVICCLDEPGPFAAQAQQQGIEVLALQKRGPFDVRVVPRLIRVMRQRQIQVVHTHLWGANLWGRFAARLAGVPAIIVTEHNVDAWKRWYHLVLDRLLASWATHLVAVSQQVRAFYDSHGVGRHRWQVISNGIDAQALPAKGRGHAYHKLGIRPDERVVGLIGRLVPAKAPQVFLEAFARAQRELPMLRGLIVGDGPLRAQLEEQVRQLGIAERVVFTGVRHDVPDLLVGMDALVFSSEREGLSMAMLEAMAVGVPVIATRVGGTPELIEDGVTGMQVPVGDSQAIADRVVELLCDPARAEAIRCAAHQHVERHFSLKAMIETHEALYEQTLASWRVSELAGSTRTPANPQTRQPAKICYIIDDLAIGGAQRQLLELAKALPRDRYEPQVISLSTTRCALAPLFRDAGIPLTLIPQSGLWSWSTLTTLTRTMRALRPQIVQTWLFTADLYGRLAAWLAGTPIIISAVRNIDLDKPAHYVMVDRLLRHVTDRFTVNAHAVGEVLQRRERVPSSSIRTIYNGVDVQAFDPACTDGLIRRQLHLEAQTPLVGMIGRLAPQKDHATFFRAAELVRDAMPAARFLVVGSGALHDTLQRLARRKALHQCLQFLKPQSRVQDVLAALDVVVVSSRYEGCCNVILEAMAMGKPVVATTVGGNPELVMHGQTGLLVAPGNPQELAEAILTLLQQPVRAKALGAQARARIESHFTLRQMVEETTMLYMGLLKADAEARA